MISKLVRNVVQFPETKLKVVSGQLPKGIKGAYFRNGPGKLNFGKDVVLPHWFMGDGAILKVAFNENQCTSQLKYVQTDLRKRRQQNKQFQQNAFVDLYKSRMNGIDYKNPANTSVLMLKNSKDFLALCEAGSPFMMQKSTLKSKGFEKFGWLQSAFSAHPKVDPENGDIYNIGMKVPNMRIMRVDKNMKQICFADWKMRQFQAIHDVCLAGDYLVFYQYPLRFSLPSLLYNNSYFKSVTYDKSLPTLVQIFKKQTLEHVKTFELPPFYNYHFTNGYSQGDKVTVEYMNYKNQICDELFEFLQEIPKLSIGQGKKHSMKAIAVLEEATFNLKTGQIKVQTQSNVRGEFPLCEDHQVGKKWRYTYLVSPENVQQPIGYNTLTKYDRETKQVKTFTDKNVYFNEPTLIRNEDILYLLSVTYNYKDDKSYVQIFDSQSMKQVCKLELPECIPPGFHGKWDANNQQ